MSPRTTLLVLSYGGASDTVACLASILRDRPAMADILVVDNASGEPTLAALRVAFPDVEILALAENRGWAGGNNAGIRLALDRGYELICLMNNDLLLEPGALACLIDTAARLPPCLLHPALYFVEPPGHPQLLPPPGRAPITGETSVYALDHAYGACLMIHAEVFRRVGLIDERFFLQLEETDFHRRARAQGFHAFCQTAARVLHKESASIGRVSPLKTYYMVRNSLLLAEKHARGPGDWLRALRQLYWSLHHLAGDGPFVLWLCSRNALAVASRRGVHDYVRRRFGPMSHASHAALAAVEA